MKNYYLKRIDELKTDIGSDSRPTPVATVSRIAAGATYPALKKGAQLATKAKQALKLPFEGLKGDVKKAIQRRKKRKDKKEADPTSPIDSGFLTRDHTTYLQIGYILAESLGLL
jgi:hypothetical protein